MNDFHQAIRTVIGDLTPQPWDWTDPAGATLTVIPAGLREAPGYGEVMVRVTASRTLAAEIGITTTYMPGLLTALDTSTAWEHFEMFGDAITVTPAPDGGVVLTVVEVGYATGSPDSRFETTAAIHVPEAQRLPLASALRRATDVAHSWED